MAKKDEELYNFTTGHEADQHFMTAAEKQKVDSARAAAQAGQISWGDANDVAESIRRNYGYSGGSDGSQFNRLDNYYGLIANKILAEGGGVGSFGNSGGGSFSYASAPKYNSRYADLLDTMAQQYVNRGPFSYDYTTDPLYKAYKAEYTREGQRAMEDTLGQLAARTGGLASSYASSAAAQANNYYMQQMTDKIPELQQLAYNQYLNEGNEMLNKLNAVQGLDQYAYNQYLNAIDQYNTDRNFAYQDYRNGIADDWQKTQWDYQLGRDALSDQWQQTQWDYGVAKDEYNKQLDFAKLAAQYGDDSYLRALGINPATIGVAGYGGGGGGGKGSNTVLPEPATISDADWRAISTVAYGNPSAALAYYQQYYDTLSESQRNLLAKWAGVDPNVLRGGGNISPDLIGGLLPDLAQESASGANFGAALDGLMQYGEAYAKNYVKQNPGIVGASGADEAARIWDMYLAENGINDVTKKSNLDYRQDEGIFTWNGKEYSTLKDLERDMNAAGLSLGDQLKLMEKFNRYGFDFSI